MRRRTRRKVKGEKEEKQKLSKETWRSLKNALCAFSLGELVSSASWEVKKLAMTKLVEENQLLMFGALTAAVCSQSNNEKVPTYGELLVSSDDVFHSNFRMHRQTLKGIFNKIRGNDCNVAFKDIFALLYYLGSADRTLRHCAKVFQMDSVESLTSILESAADFIIRIICDDARVVFPDEEEQEIIAANIEKKFGFPDVLGVIGIFKISCWDEDKTKIVVQVVCDHNLIFRDLYASSLSPDVDEMDMLKCSSLYNRLIAPHEKGRYLLGNCSYDLLEQILPAYVDTGNLSPQATEFNVAHARVMTLLKSTLQKAVFRFPKLTSLEIPSLRIAMAALILHNKCQMEDSVTFH